MRAFSALGLVASATLLAAPAVATAGRVATETVLVSDQAGIAAQTDPDLQNAWGLAFDAARGVVWIADNHSGVATAYHPDGTPVGTVVTIPAAGGTGTGAPTGVVFNTTNGFSNNHLLFVTEDGLVAGWTSGRTATVEVDRSGSGAVYKGVAMAQVRGHRELFATDFHNGNVDVFDQNFDVVTPSRSFTDPHAPAGFAPFDVASIGSRLYVTFAKQDADRHDDVAGAGNGFIDVFDGDGKLVRRLASGTAAGGKLAVLDSPWGMAVGRFGSSAKSLLVGNFGSGQIAILDPRSGKLRGTVNDASGRPLAVDGLWSLAFGPGGAAGSSKTLFFTAGPNDEANGRFGTLTPSRAGSKRAR